MTGAESDDSKPWGELVITRVFRAPRELVFEVWTRAEHFVHWFGPHAAQIPFCEIDARPGGVIHFCHQFDDGAKLWLRGVFREVVVPERLVFSLGFVDAQGSPAGLPIPDWPRDAVVETVVQLDATREGTRVSVRQRVEPPEAAALESVKSHQRLAREGWTEMFDRLAEQLAKVTAALGG